ncbi:MAG TPA: hypothetical protein PL012_20435, partial [Candidatus Obscuribacter sp.]|nr:hypothetical protein [Candidatus Obscuribacter sp.]
EVEPSVQAEPHHLLSLEAHVSEVGPRIMEARTRVERGRQLARIHDVRLHVGDVVRDLRVVPELGAAAQRDVERVVVIDLEGLPEDGVDVEVTAANPWALRGALKVGLTV